MNQLLSKAPSKPISWIIIVTMVVVQIGWFASDVTAGTPDEDLKTIQYRYYFRGKYVESITQLQTYLARTDLDIAHERSAREFLAASYVLSGDAEQGQSTFVDLVLADEAYAGPDASVFKESVVAAYIVARDQVAAVRLRQAPVTVADGANIDPTLEKIERPIYKKWWFYAGIATALLIAGSIAGEKEDDPAPAADRGSVSVGVTVR
jgi:hypothetical protein